jgi:hypothetical protein
MALLDIAIANTAIRVSIIFFIIVSFLIVQHSVYFIFDAAKIGQKQQVNKGFSLNKQRKIPNDDFPLPFVWLFYAFGVSNICRIATSVSPDSVQGHHR